jgi:hypothetical protein
VVVEAGVEMIVMILVPIIEAVGTATIVEETQIVIRICEIFHVAVIQAMGIMLMMSILRIAIYAIFMVDTPGVNVF